MRAGLPDEEAWHVSLLVFFMWLLASDWDARPAAPERTLFEERFDASGLEDGWSWVREDPGGWSLSGGTLRIRTQGSLWVKENTQKNILVRDPPPGTDGGFAVEVTVRGAAGFTEAYEHAGLIWYVDDDNWLTLTHLNHVEDRTRKILLVYEAGGRDGSARSVAVPFDGERVELRILLDGGKFRGFYRSSPDLGWIELGAAVFPGGAAASRIGLVAGEGPEERGHWASFDDFRILGRHARKD